MLLETGQRGSTRACAARAAWISGTGRCGRFGRAAHHSASTGDGGAVARSTSALDAWRICTRARTPSRSHAHSLPPPPRVYNTHTEAQLYTPYHTVRLMLTSTPQSTGARAVDTCWHGLRYVDLSGSKISNTFNVDPVEPTRDCRCPDSRRTCVIRASTVRSHCSSDEIVQSPLSSWCASLDLHRLLPIRRT
eukprot:2961932-Pleurochrysis_carterae.AAC.1